MEIIKNFKGVIKMGLVVVGTALSAIAVMLTLYECLCLTHEATEFFLLILGIALTAFFCIGIATIQVGMTEQQTIQVESGDISES